LISPGLGKLVCLIEAVDELDTTFRDKGVREVKMAVTAVDMEDILSMIV
jgi:hypothetical protein